MTDQESDEIGIFMTPPPKKSRRRADIYSLVSNWRNEAYQEESQVKDYYASQS
jgi:hypothetical protein